MMCVGGGGWKGRAGRRSSCLVRQSMQARSASKELREEVGPPDPRITPSSAPMYLTSLFRPRLSRDPENDLPNLIYSLRLEYQVDAGAQGRATLIMPTSLLQRAADGSPAAGFSASPASVLTSVPGNCLPAPVVRA